MKKLTNRQVYELCRDLLLKYGFTDEYYTSLLILGVSYDLTQEQEDLVGAFKN